MKTTQLELTEVEVLEAFEKVPEMGLNEFAELTERDMDTAHHALWLYRRKGLLRCQGYVYSLREPRQ